MIQVYLLVDDPNLTDEQKHEIILTVWGIMSKLVDAIYDGTVDDAALRSPTYNKELCNFRRPSRTRKTRKS